MCYSAMQAQAAKSKLFMAGFAHRISSEDFDRTVFPLQPFIIGRQVAGVKETVEAQYGLVPDWVKDEKGGPKFGRYCYNARSETIFEKPSFKAAILKRRAVVPVSAFFEFPDKEEPLRHRYRISRRDGQPFWLAAVWEYSSRYALTSCSVITGEPLALVEKFHSRSPIILADDQVNAWLDPDLQSQPGVAAFLKTGSSEDLELLEEAWKGKKGTS